MYFKGRHLVYKCAPCDFAYFLRYNGNLLKIKSIISDPMPLMIYTENVKLSLCFINYAPCHEGVLGSGGIALPFLTSALVGSE
jgi:hypothetical protein